MSNSGPYADINWSQTGARSERTQQYDPAFGPHETIDRVLSGGQRTANFEVVTIPKGVDVQEYLAGTLNNLDARGQVRDSGRFNAVVEQGRQANQAIVDGIKERTGSSPAELTRETAYHAAGVEDNPRTRQGNVTIARSENGELVFSHRDLGNSQIRVTVAEDASNPARVTVSATETIDGPTQRSMREAAGHRNPAYAKAQDELRRAAANTLRPSGVDTASLLQRGSLNTSIQGDAALNGIVEKVEARRTELHQGTIDANRALSGAVDAATADPATRQVIDTVTEGLSERPAHPIAVDANGEFDLSRTPLSSFGPELRGQTVPLDPNGPLARALTETPLTPTADERALLQQPFRPVGAEPGRTVSIDPNGAFAQALEAAPSASHAAKPELPADVWEVPESMRSQVAPPEPARLDGRSQLGNTRLGGEAAPPAPPSGGTPDVPPHAGGGGHSPHVKAASAAGRILGVAGGTILAAGLGATTAGASELMHGNGMAAAAEAAGKAGAQAALDATPGVNSVKAVAEGREREANVRAWESMPIVGGVYGEIRRPMERYLNGAGESAPDNRRVDPGVIESGVSTALNVAREGVNQVANWWNGASAQTPLQQQEQATPSPSEKPVQPEQGGMAAILAQARQATASMTTKVEVHSESNMPLPSSQVVHNAKAPETSAGVGHA